MQLTGRPTRIALVALAAAVSYACLEQPTPDPYWEDPAVFAENREPPRASFTPFTTAPGAATGRPDDSPFRISLTGDWKFHWVPQPDQRPLGVCAAENRDRYL